MASMKASGGGEQCVFREANSVRCKNSGVICTGGRGCKLTLGRAVCAEIACFRVQQ